MKLILLFTVAFLFVQHKEKLPVIAESASHDPNQQSIPLGGNAWTSDGGKITEKGLTNWTSPETVCGTYFKTTKGGTLKLSLFLNPNGSESKISVTIFDKSVEFVANGNTEKEYFVGEWNVPEAGYVVVSIEGMEKTKDSFGTVSKLVVSGGAVTENMNYTKNNDDKFYYWGRRGPSVHLNYSTNNNDNIEWFYNEVTIPKNNDVVGSYFMANGFAEGYFGMQVNSNTERRILFSVWSPFSTDNPGAIPPDQRILLLKKGTNVFTGEFGNEGSGGQSYLKYNWKADNTYRFLLQGKPTTNNSTVYTAYFFDPEQNQWLLIASFKRPKTTTYLKNLSSFLENFDTETGNIERLGNYDNQWVMNAKGQWKELTQARFTADNTARQGYRVDYDGGEEDGKFYLRNCGFFNDNTELDQNFSRTAKNKPPVIDFSKLP